MLVAQQMAEMDAICQRISRNSPTMIQLSNGTKVRFDDDMLNRLRKGERYTVSDWYSLSNFLFPAKAVKAVVSVGPVSILPAPQEDEIGLWIREVTSTNNLTQWCCTIYQSPERTVKTFAVRETDRERVSLGSIAAAFRVLPHTLLYSCYQVSRSIKFVEQELMSNPGDRSDK